jgi:hypothetical protein
MPGDEDDLSPDNIRYHPKVSSDLAFNRKHECPTGVLFISDSTGVKPPYNYWMEARSSYHSAVNHFRNEGFDTFSFTPYSSKSAFRQLLLQRIPPSAGAHPGSV